MCVCVLILFRGFLKKVVSQFWFPFKSAKLSPKKPDAHQVWRRSADGLLAGLCLRLNRRAPQKWKPRQRFGGSMNSLTLPSRLAAVCAQTPIERRLSSWNVSFCTWNVSLRTSIVMRVNIWAWLKIKQEGQTAGFGTHVSTYQGNPFWNSVFFSHSHFGFGCHVSGNQTFGLLASPLRETCGLTSGASDHFGELVGRVSVPELGGTQICQMWMSSATSP